MRFEKKSHWEESTENKLSPEIDSHTPQMDQETQKKFIRCSD